MKPVGKQVLYIVCYLLNGSRGNFVNNPGNGAVVLTAAFPIYIFQVSSERVSEIVFLYRTDQFVTTERIL